MARTVFDIPSEVIHSNKGDAFSRISFFNFQYTLLFRSAVGFEKRSHHFDNLGIICDIAYPGLNILSVFIAYEQSRVILICKRKDRASASLFRWLGRMKRENPYSGRIRRHCCYRTSKTLSEEAVPISSRGQYIQPISYLKLSMNVRPSNSSNITLSDI